MNNYTATNKDLKVFFLVNFGLTILMGMIMSLAYPMGMVDAFPLLQMYYPALGAMTALLMNKDIKDELPRKYFYSFIFIVVTSVIYTLLSIFILKIDPNIYLQIWLMAGSVILIIMHNIEDRDKMKNSGLKFRTNFKKVIFYIGLFTLLYLLATLISSVVGGDINEFLNPFKSITVWISLISLPLIFALSLAPFLGEEYGWRYFLQPALQKRAGKRKGIILLGLIWGIWHLPINIFYYSPQTWIYSVLNQLVVCVCYSVFFGLAYTKTRNIWSVTIIHFINNNLGAVLYGAEPKNLVLTWQMVVFNLILLSVIYLPFFISKEYRKTEDVQPYDTSEELSHSPEE